MGDLQIILLEDVQGAGVKGETITVKPGYFRNFLEPKKMAAVVGSKEACLLIKEEASRKKVKEAKAEEKKEIKTKQAEKRKESVQKKEKLLGKNSKK